MQHEKHIRIRVLLSNEILLCSLKEVGDYLEVSKRTIQRKIAEQIFPAPIYERRINARGVVDHAHKRIWLASDLAHLKPKKDKK